MRIPINLNRALLDRVLLEIKFQRELNSARRTCEGGEPIGGRSQLRSGILRNRIRIREFRIRMVPGIEEFRAEFYALLFADWKGLEE